jgi:hypothetical protein
MAKQATAKQDERKARYEKELAVYEKELAAYERQLAGYLQERIKPGLSRSAIPLMARSIAKEIARQEPPEPIAGTDTANPGMARLWTSRQRCTNSKRSSARTGSCVSRSMARTVG